LKNWQLLTLLSVLFCGIFLCPSACAAGSIEFKSYQFSSSKIYQGEFNVHVDLGIRNNGNSSLIVHGAFVHFDWQTTEENFMEGSQRSGEPWDFGKELEPNENHTIRIHFSVPTLLSEGDHLFFFRVYYNDGAEAQWNPYGQDISAVLTIYDMWEPIYSDRVITVEGEVAQAESAGFISPEAKSLLQRAGELLSEAHSYADEGKMQSAVSRLRSTSNMIEEAYEVEQGFRTYVMIIGGIIGIGAVIGAGLFVLVRRKRSSKSISNAATESSSAK